MATSLFGPSPLELQQAQQNALRSQATQYAQLNPLDRAAQTMYQAGSNLGGGIAGLMGVQDPAMKRQSDIAAIVSKYDIANPEDLQKASQELMAAGFQQEASLAIGKANELSKAQADINQVRAKTQQEAAAAQAAAYKVSQDEQLRTQLAALPPDATQEDFIKTVMKYGSPDKVLTIVQQAADKQAAREQAVQMQKERIQAKLEADLRDAKTQKERDAAKAESRLELAQVVASLKPVKEAPPLSTADIRQVAAARGALSSVNSTINQVDTFTKDIEKGKLQFGAAENLLSAGRTAIGKATESDLKKVQFNQFVQQAVNNLLLAAKGTQTEGDAKRAAEQVTSALARNDSNAVKASLEQLKNVLQDTKVVHTETLDLYAKERPSLAKGTGTKENPIVLK